jgi:hypothetical protein
MRLKIKLTGPLFSQIVHDLARPHPFAAERAGFVFGRIGSLVNNGKVIIFTRYHSIPDDQYMDDPTVGARIGGAALTWAMQAVHSGRPAREGIFHVHMHRHTGEPRMSKIDNRDIPQLMPGFRSVSPSAAHGIVLLSLDHGSVWVWLPDHDDPVCADTFSVIGAPIKVFERRITT